jgi:hypothetical protein
MDGDAPSVMGSPELEDHYPFVIENVCRALREPARIRDLNVIRPGEWTNDDATAHESGPQGPPASLPLWSRARRRQ